MANIKSQIKRNNRSVRERFENRHYTSAIKTYFRRLETAVDGGDEEQITVEHRKLVSLIDKAVKRGALHANTGGRKKARAERMRRGAGIRRDIPSAHPDHPTLGLRSRAVPAACPAAPTAAACRLRSSRRRGSRA